MAQRQTTTATVGVAGSGKTLVRCAYYLPDQFLKFETGIFYTNFPVNIDAVVEWCRTHGGPSEEDVRRRIVILPDEMLKEWGRTHDKKTADTDLPGPWEFFKDLNLGGAHIALDEAHNFLGRKHEARVRRKWQEFCGELRHRGASIEFLSQDVSKLAEEVMLEAGTMYRIQSSETLRDPYFGILMGDWYELKAGFLTGQYTPWVVEQEMRRSQGWRKWAAEKSRYFAHDPARYKLYDSFNTRHDVGDEEREKIKVHEPDRMFKRLGKFGLLRWFVFKNFEPLFIRFAIVLAMYLLTFGGLPAYGLQFMIKASTAMAEGNGAKIAMPQAEAKPGRKKGPTLSPDAPHLIRELKAGDEKHAPEVDAELERRALSAERKLKVVREWQKFQSDIVGMTSSMIVLRDGRQIKLGEVMEDGPVLGKLESVDPRRRRCVIGGRVCNMATRDQSRRAEAAYTAMVSGDGGGSPSGVQNGKGKQAGVDDSAGSSSWGLRPHAGGGGGSLRGGGGVPGQQNGQPGGQGYSGGGGSRFGGSSSGGAVDQGGPGLLPGGSSPGGPGDFSGQNQAIDR